LPDVFSKLGGFFTTV
jgi:hypothetical protein